MRGKYSVNPVMPPSLGLPPAIQKISAKDGRAWRAGAGVVPLEVVNAGTMPAGADLSQAVRGAGKAARAVLQTLRAAAGRRGARRGAGGFLRFMRAAKGADAADPRD